MVSYRGVNLQYVIDMPFPNDSNGYNIFDNSGMPRNNIRFTGLLSNGMPFIGCITFEFNGFKYTLEGKFNKHLNLVGIGKQTYTYNDMIAFG